MSVTASVTTDTTAMTSHLNTMQTHWQNAHNDVKFKGGGSDGVGDATTQMNSLQTDLNTLLTDCAAVLTDDAAGHAAVTTAVATMKTHIATAQTHLQNLTNDVLRKGGGLDGVTDALTQLGFTAGIINDVAVLRADVAAIIAANV